jgi:outer membrane protein OmpA-like peptidoglycan-associated protein
VNEAPSRRRGRHDDSWPPEQTSFALYGPDPLEPVRDAIVRQDPDIFVGCFTPEGTLRVPRPEGDLLIRGKTNLARAGRDFQATIRELSWTPSRRFVSADEVTEEAVVVVQLHQRRAGRAAAPASPSSEEGIRVPLRAVATLGPEGLISGLTLWLDWAALSDPHGVASARGAASALVALARSRDDRGLRVLQAPAQPVIVDREVPLDPEPEPERPKPMSRSAVWWELHRAGVAGSAMAVAAVMLLAWVGLNVLMPLHQISSPPSVLSGDQQLGTLAGAEVGSAGVGAGPGSVKSSGSAKGSGSGKGSAGGAENSGQAGKDPQADTKGSRQTSSSNPEATGAGPDGTGAPVLSSQDPDVKPTVQRGKKYTFLSDVLFRSGAFDLSEQAQTRLDKLAGQIRAAGVEGDVQVNGYTDNIGSDAYNLALGRQRALAVANALSQRLDGVNVQLHVQAFGESSPRASNTTDEGRRQNRRVIVVLPEKH